METLGRECGSCEGWSTIRGDVMMEDRPFGPPDTFPDQPLEPMPWSMEIFIDANPDAVEPYLNPFQKCAEGGEKFRQVAGQRIYSMPAVELHDTMFDSARVASGAYVEDPLGAHVQWSLEGRFAQGAQSYKAVQLLEDCLAAPGPCWESTMASPPKGLIWVEAAASNTTIPRAALAAAMSGGTVPAYGSRNTAVHGYFDRSKTELFTAVPQIYVDSGVSPAGYDYRGGSTLDWRHDSAFLEPDPFRNDSLFPHVDSAFAGWLTPHDSGGRRSGYFEYRADWKTDALLVRRRPGTELSYCALPEQLSVDLDAVGFWGGSLAQEKVVPANLVFPSAVSPVSVSSTASRWGTTVPASSP